MTDRIEVLGCEARQIEPHGWCAETPLGRVRVLRETATVWIADWWPAHEMRVDLVLHVDGHRSPADAAREATRRLRAIQRTCARAGAL